MTTFAIAKDILLNSMVIGYSETSVFDSLANLVPPVIAPGTISHALNAPSWTLHVEFWGSMLVLLLAMLWRGLDRRLFWAIFSGLLLLTGSSHFSLFMLGFLLFHAYSNNKSIQGNALNAVIGALMIVTGLYICIAKDVVVVSAALSAIRSITWMDASSNFHWQSQVGAMLVFVGVMLSGSGRSFLAMPLAQWLGKVSFSVYLLHFPILLTVGCAVFTLLPDSYALACVLSALVGITLTFFLAALFEKYVDRRSVSLSKQIGGNF